MKQEKKQNKKMKTRVILVLLFIALFSVISYISLRGSYLEYKELGENYTEVFFTNLKSLKLKALEIYYLYLLALI